jgi:hypothetical protein
VREDSKSEMAFVMKRLNIRSRKRLVLKASYDIFDTANQMNSPVLYLGVETARIQSQWLTRGDMMRDNE